MALTSLYSAVSGMDANGTALSVIGDNVANMNTTAFKASRATFGDVLSQTLSSGQVGRGVLVNSVKPQFQQGTFESSSNVLDMAVDGEGFFVLNDGSADFYTRAGQFDVNNAGDVIAANGAILQGFQYSSSGTATSTIGDINVSSLNSQPNPTTAVTVAANLDSRASSTLGAFSVSSPDATSNFSTSVTAYDSLGNDHSVNIYFRNNGDNATDATRTDWQWRAVVGASDSASGSAEIQASGTLTFTSGGALYSESAITSPLASGGFDFASGAAAGQAITFDFGTTIAADSTTGFAGTTQFGAASSTVALTQDGYSSGSLKSVTIAPTGVVTGIFTNGQSRDISQIVLAKFAAPTELTKLGENLFASSSASGQAVVNAPGGSGVGSVVSNTLELSNVDLAQEFVKMIVNQRGFQANSRIITVSDELLSEVVNLKR